MLCSWSDRCREVVGGGGGLYGPTQSYPGYLGPSHDQERAKGVRGVMKKKIPKFSSEDAEREFWATADSTDYIDWKKGRRMLFPKLRPSLKTISLRLPEIMLEELKLLANKRDVPYQSLLKIFLSERLEQELKLASHRPNDRSG